ncbi:MAG: hypothetical protein QOH64_410 [Acidimicrobiaceae bacterium]|jgi:S1-C subfamily serine protease
MAALALVGGLAGGWAAGSQTSGSSATSTAPAVARASLDLSGQALNVAGVLSKVQASVVSIETTISVRRGSSTQQGSGAGTGIVLDDRGDIITNAHVVEGATTVQVTVTGESSPRSATVVASNTAADIAVVRVDDPTGLVAAPFGQSSQLQVGDQVVAIGNALALEGGMTVTEGIVSALGRSIATDSSSTLSDLIQTDAAISSGNSGGALVNAAGEVVGINTAVASSGSGVQASNIGFAISIDKARSVAATLLAGR